MRALGPGAALVRSLRIFATRPVSMLSLGAALLISLVAVCCGVGLFAAPWFMCELFALQIGSAGESPRRTVAWLAAGFLQLSAILVLALIALLAALALGPDVLLGALARAGSTPGERLFSVASAALATGACALALTVHFQYAPALLIERGGTLLGALLESAELVAAGGLVRGWVTSAAAHALPWAALTLTAGALLAVGGSRAPTLAILLLALPLLALSSALSQGMVIASYLALRSESAPVLVPPALPWLRATLPFALAGLYALTPLLLLVGLLEPTSLARGPLPAAATVAIDMVPAERARERYLPGSALRLVLARERLEVIASDGGGAGALPLPEASAIARVRVARVELPGGQPEALRGAQFAIEARLEDGATYVTTIDESGVRLDDSLERRFAELLPRPAVYVFDGAWVWLVLASARILPRLAAIARGGEVAAFARAMTMALIALAPPAVLSFALALWALRR